MQVRRGLEAFAAIVIGLICAGCVQSQDSGSVHVRPVDENRPLDQLRDGSIDPALVGLSGYAMLAADSYLEEDEPGLTCNGYRSTPWERLKNFS